MPIRKRTLRTASIVAAIAGLVVLLSSVIEYGESGKIAVAPVDLATLREYDSYLLEPSGTTYRANGAVAYRWQAKRANRQHDGTVLLFSPTYRGLKNGDQSWTAVARNGRLSADGQTLALEHDVLIRDFIHNALLFSPKLLLDMAKNELFTAAPVRFTSPDAVTTAIGMRAAMDSERLEFLAEVKGYYENP